MADTNLRALAEAALAAERATEVLESSDDPRADKLIGAYEDALDMFRGNFWHNDYLALLAERDAARDLLDRVEQACLDWAAGTKWGVRRILDRIDLSPPEAQS